jgi:hypothetical protein
MLASVIKQVVSGKKRDARISAADLNVWMV